MVSQDNKYCLRRDLTILKHVDHPLVRYNNKGGILFENLISSATLDLYCEHPDVDYWSLRDDIRERILAMAGASTSPSNIPGVDYPSKDIQGSQNRS